MRVGEAIEPLGRKKDKKYEYGGDEYCRSAAGSGCNLGPVASAVKTKKRSPEMILESLLSVSAQSLDRQSVAVTLVGFLLLPRLELCDRPSQGYVFPLHTLPVAGVSSDGRLEFLVGRLQAVVSITTTNKHLT